MRQHAPACTCACPCMRQHASASASMRQHAPACPSMRLHARPKGRDVREPLAGQRPPRHYPAWAGSRSRASGPNDTTPQGQAAARGPAAPAALPRKGRQPFTGQRPQRHYPAWAGSRSRASGPNGTTPLGQVTVRGPAAPTALPAWVEGVLWEGPLTAIPRAQHLGRGPLSGDLPVLALIRN